MRYSIRRISPFSALFYGLLVGLIAWLIPGILVGWSVARIIGRLQLWLTTLKFEIPLPLGQNIPVDLITLLQLSDQQARLAGLAGRDTALIIAVALATAAGGMLLTGLTALIVALVYNLFAYLLGGVQVTLDALDAPPSNRQQSAKVVAAGLADQNTVSPASAKPAPKPPATTPVGSAWLLSSSDNSQRWKLGQAVTRIGSDGDNDIVLPGLGSHHAEIRKENGQYIIYDLGTRQTWVNTNQVATAHLLKNGFKVQLGTAEYVVQILTPSG